jgi:hypothetical protein
MNTTSHCSLPSLSLFFVWLVVIDHVGQASAYAHIRSHPPSRHRNKRMKELNGWWWERIYVRAALSTENERNVHAHFLVHTIPLTCGRDETFLISFSVHKFLNFLSSFCMDQTLISSLILFIM